MKTLIMAAALTLATAGASAHDVYRGLAQGSPDLNDQHGSPAQVLGVQPGVGTVTDIYSGFADGNPDLFPRGTSAQGYGLSGSRSPDIYQNLCSRDLTC